VGTIAAIDVSAALAMEGVVGFVSAEDVEQVGAVNAVAKTPMRIFASGAVLYVGEIVGLVCATSFAVAKAAAAKVVVQYESEACSPIERIIADADPIVIPPAGDVTTTQTFTGGLATPGQRHFYMETQATFAVPDGTGGLEVNCSVQKIDTTHQTLASTLQIPMNKLVIQNQRLGGAFGGKAFICYGIAAAACVAALSLNRPVMLQLDRNNDFLGLGGRSACDAVWSVDVDDSGRIGGLSKTVTCDAGIDKSGGHNATSLNAYDISGARLSSQMKVTSRPWATMMRAPGEFQGVFIMEAIIEQVARKLGVDPTVIQESNMLSDSYNAGVRKIWGDLKGLYDEQRLSVDEFNTSSRWIKQGVYMMPLQYIPWPAFPGDWPERAVVAVHGDGSVSLDTTGIEMGQGLNTKAEQMAAMVFRQLAPDFELDLVLTVVPKSTARLNYGGTFGTACSGTSECVAAAVRSACEQLVQTLSAYRSEGSWRAMVQKATAAGASLTATGSRQRFLALYPTPCAGLAKVQLDVHTGEVQVMRAEIFEDCGKSLNPAVDVGQIEGCFVQALGFCLTEEELVDPDDLRMKNNSAWLYKIPRSNQIPVEMNVTLPKGENQAAGNVVGSKAVGEASICVGAATFFALKDAISAARRDAGLEGYVRMDVPATAARIKEACGSQF